AAFEKLKTRDVMREVAQELGEILKEALADPTIKAEVGELSAEFTSKKKISDLLDDALSDPQTKAALKQLRTDDGLSARLSEILPKLTQSVKDEVFQGFDEFFDEFNEVLNSPDTQSELMKALRRPNALSDLFDKKRLEPVVGDAIRSALAWDAGLSGLLAQALDEKAPTQNVLRNAVVLAHWDSQGYKFEQHVDIADFCDRLQERCDDLQGQYDTIADADTSDSTARRIADTCRKVSEACNNVKNVIDSRMPGATNLVLTSAYCGPAFQYSCGISIFYPWAEMKDASGFREMEHYGSLEFAHDTQWDEFVNAYHKVTQRQPRPGRGTIHPSTLNRYDSLFTGQPGKFVTPISTRLGTALTAQVTSAIGDRLGTALNARFAGVATAINIRLGTALNARLGTALNARLGTALNARLGTALNARLGTALNARLGTALNARLGTAL